MTEQKLEAILVKMLERKLVDRHGRVQTFEEAGLLTRDRGVVLRLGHYREQEYQISIVRSK